MIPKTLKLSGFLSYQDEVEVDFSTISLACISGPNGAGKSSLLDAITWALFGQARKRDDSVINSQRDSAEVSFIFEYENNIYRVIRSKERDKGTLLEFQIGYDSMGWKTLTERTIRGTQEQIESTLRMDYETFVNASFFLQGKADQFTQQRAGERKKILGNILGLEVWEDYRKKAFELSRELQQEKSVIEGRRSEILAELDEEEERKKQQAELESLLAQAGKNRETQEALMEELRKNASILLEQQKMADTLKEQVERVEKQQAETGEKLKSRTSEKEKFTNILKTADDIRNAHQEYLAIKELLAKWDEVAVQFQELEQKRREPLTKIETEKAKLETEIAALQKQKAMVENTQENAKPLKEKAGKLSEEKIAIEQKLKEKEALEARQHELDAMAAELKAENQRLRKEMDELVERINQLKASEGADCPLCGQPLSPDEKSDLLAELQKEGEEKGTLFRKNKEVYTNTLTEQENNKQAIQSLASLETQLRSLNEQFAQKQSEIQYLENQIRSWEEEGQRRLSEIQEKLVNEAYGEEARKTLKLVDEELKSTGYDIQEHNRIRTSEKEKRSIEETVQELSTAETSIALLDREISELENQITTLNTESQKRKTEYNQVAEQLLKILEDSPDMEKAEHDLKESREQENTLRMRVGAAQQKVAVLGELRKRLEEINAQWEDLIQRISQYDMLERSFSKNGVPAMLIEQALPQIESRANDLLDRLSNGNMSLSFVTQQEYKTKRDGMRETLDITISDSLGQRDYEMFSGGEAFRINFSIRLALSEVLAQRAGARLQTLVIDEGFGSQDEMGRQRLIEAINMVKDDFKKILVITHIDSLKDAFPNRIEVSKNATGSTLLVV
ncbi:MAG: SMC family ATPase [Anaerolineales bacterium]|nr:SMC family ATPase [Anaerolineales bacterium]